jgi:hypothetical protein
VSWPDLMTPWAGDAPPDPLRVTILGGLAYAALACRDHGHCAGCQPGRPCPDHASDAGLAGQFEAAYMQVAAGSAAWCGLAVALISEMN